MDVPGAPPCGEAVDAQSAERTEHKENNGAADKVFPNTGKYMFNISCTVSEYVCYLSKIAFAGI